MCIVGITIEVQIMVFMADENVFTLNLGDLANEERNILYRDEEFKKIMLTMDNGVNVHIYGPTSTGKSITVRRAIEKFNNSTHKAIYVNCSRCRTEHSVLEAIFDAINDIHPQREMFAFPSNDVMLRRLEKAKTYKYVDIKYIVLDNFSILKEPKTVDDLLGIFNLIIVSEEKKAINKINNESQKDIGSIEFRKYTDEQVVKIINKKAKALVGEGHYKEPVVLKIAERSEGNIGHGIRDLLTAAINAKSCEKAYVDETDLPLAKKEPDIEGHQKIILRVVEEKRRLQPSEWYGLYCEEVKNRELPPRTERMFRYYVQDLVNRKIVKAVGRGMNRTYILIVEEENKS